MLKRNQTIFPLKPTFILLTGILITFFAQAKISGEIMIDSTWNRRIYVTLITDFSKLNSMSNQMIIDQTEIDTNGKFAFYCDYLPKEFKLYRLHISKKGDPPASLIIGGKDENYMFFVANRSSKISINNKNSGNIFGNIEIIKSPQSQLLNEVNQMLLYVDTTSFYDTPIKRELMENALDEKLRQFADTCSFPLVALYAIYKSNFEKNISENPGFYIRFLEKWSDEESPYFEEFRRKVPHVSARKSYSLIYGIVGVIVGVIFMFLVQKGRTSKSQSILQDLTLQERKIFDLLHEARSNKEISDELNISLSTVKSHVNSIFSKLNIKSRREISKF